MKFIDFPYFLQVRVVHGLADCDFQDTSVMELLSDFIAELVNDGELMLARALRTKFIQKYEDRKLRLLPEIDTSGLSFSNKTGLLSFKSMDLAEQMTLLDAQLFLRLDSAELILWVQVSLHSGPLLGFPKDGCTVFLGGSIVGSHSLKKP